MARTPAGILNSSPIRTLQFCEAVSVKASTQVASWEREKVRSETRDGKNEVMVFCTISITIS